MNIQKAAAYCTGILEEISNNRLPFHNIDHTKGVVSHVRVMCQHLSICEEDSEPIVLAAWFHDIGYTKTYIGHEAVSAQMAYDFLETISYDPEKTEIVMACIQATKVPQSPQSFYADILCDADLYHLGSSACFYWQTLLRREWDLALGKTYSNKEWYALNSEFLSKHQFHSDYGKKTLDPVKNENELRSRKLSLAYQ